ncbi:myosin light chain kinase, smooth muscle-like [Musca vetustissima]|uniref:myosin light chain kinase, smooth muscle-like n=1 Tax=Musca vetustissima TaxID=27455 RepID=UPI002AB6FBF5|nr:myosin light chain kinase, smooth muscle-like [Musca vetustissima]
MEVLKFAVNLCQKDITALEGSAVRIECEIVCEADRKIIWYQNDQPLEESERIQILAEANKAVLIIKDIKKDDAGVYKIVVSNGADEITDTCKVNVTTPTEVGDKSENKEVVAPECPVEINTIITPPTPDLAKGDSVFLDTNVVDGKTEAENSVEQKEVVAAAISSEPTATESVKVATENIECGIEAVEASKQSDTSSGITQENSQNQEVAKNETDSKDVEVVTSLKETENSAPQTEDTKAENIPSATETQATSDKSTDVPASDLKGENPPSATETQASSDKSTEIPASEVKQDVATEVKPPAVEQPSVESSEVTKPTTLTEQQQTTEVPESPKEENVKATEVPKSQPVETPQTDESSQQQADNTKTTDEIKSLAKSEPTDTSQDNNKSENSTNVTTETQTPKEETPKVEETAPADITLDPLTTLPADETKNETSDSNQQSKDTQTSELPAVTDLPTTIAETCQTEVTSLLTQALGAVDTNQPPKECGAEVETQTPKEETAQLSEPGTNIASTTDSSAVQSAVPEAPQNQSEQSGDGAKDTTTEIKPSTEETNKSEEPGLVETSGEVKLETQTSTVEPVVADTNSAGVVATEDQVKVCEAVAPPTDQVPAEILAEVCPKEGTA